MKAGLSFVTVGIVVCIDNEIKHHFWSIFENDSILIAVVCPNSS